MAAKKKAVKKKKVAAETPVPAPAPKKRGGKKRVAPVEVMEDSADVAEVAATNGKGSLVIVESPTKAKTIGKYLGRGYTVKATIGHLRDLPRRKLGVDVEHGFEPEYVTIKEKAKTLAEIKKAARSASQVLIATDPDREGEAIAWHVAGQLAKGGKVRRVLFHEITKEAVKLALANPLDIDQKKVDAQQARRILDRLVGYKASPLLWKSIKTGLSAGRVQTVALRLICEREDEIRKFVPQEYWTIEADLEKDGQAFQARLHKLDGAKPDIKDQATAQGIVDAALETPLRGHRRHQEGTPPQPARPLHYQHPAAGGGQAAGLLGQSDHACCAGALRGRGRGCRRARRPHHLHAHRLRPRGGLGHRTGARVHQRELRPEVPPRHAERARRQARGERADPGRP